MGWVKCEVAGTVFGLSTGVGAREDGAVCVVGEAGLAELGFEEEDGGTVGVVWVEGGERGGETEAGLLLDRMITLYKVLVFVSRFRYLSCVSDWPGALCCVSAMEEVTYGGAAGNGSGGSGSSPRAVGRVSLRSRRL